MRAALAAVCAVLLSSCTFYPLPAKQASQFRVELDRVRAEFGLPGITAAYILSDGTVETAASGLADVEAGRPMTGTTRMLSASIGKSFVGALCISLALEGRLALDEPVSQWIGAFDWFSHLPNHESITLRHLLTHSSGIPDHVYMASFAEAFAAEWQNPHNAFSPERTVGFVLDEPALFPAGGGWAYSDTGYILAGLVIEAVTGRPFFQGIQQRFLDPLGLLDTTFADRPDLDRLAAGYMRADNIFGLPEKSLDDRGHLHWNPSVEWAGGGHISTSRDIALWGAALFSGEAMAGDYLADLLMTVEVEPDSADVGYGAGVAVYTTGPFGPVYGHAGWVPGYVSSLRHYPETGVTIAFQINTDIGIIDSTDDVLKIIEEKLINVFVNRNG